MSQDTVDKKLKEWNETWFGNNQKIDVKKATDNIPNFLKKRWYFIREVFEVML